MAVAVVAVVVVAVAVAVPVALGSKVARKSYASSKSASSAGAEVVEGQAHGSCQLPSSASPAASASAPTTEINKYVLQVLFEVKNKKVDKRGIKSHTDRQADDYDSIDNNDTFPHVEKKKREISAKKLEQDTLKKEKDDEQQN